MGYWAGLWKTLAILELAVGFVVPAYEYIYVCVYVYTCIYTERERERERETDRQTLPLDL